MIRSFLETLYETGTATVPMTATNHNPFDAVLIDIDMRVRLDSPGDMPHLSLPSARWGVIMLYTSCQFMVYRDVSAEAVAAGLALQCPEQLSPRSVYSVDLGLPFLPQVYEQAKRFAVYRAAGLNDFAVVSQEAAYVYPIASNPT